MTADNLTLQDNSVRILTSGWEFKQKDAADDQWLPVARVPSVVHLDLLNNGKIPNPYVGLNELEVEWVGEKAWTYRVQIEAPKLSSNHKTLLIFEGLDTLANVSLNGQQILKSNNMFLSHTVDVTHILNGKNNILSIDFESSLLQGRRIQDQYPEYDFIAHNGEPGRLGVRKAQYHWGWDWGPSLMCCGPWRPVRLETYAYKVVDLWADVRLDSSLAYADGTLFAKIDGAVNSVEFFLRYAAEVVQVGTALVQDGVAAFQFHLDNPKLWFPHGYGNQSLYEIVAVPLNEGNHNQPVSKKIGFRRAELVQNNDGYGQSFLFRVNNVDIFCGGSCWIPADSFLPSISPQRYQKWLQLMVNSGQVMSRVWGGGIYEADLFYDLCDELGILVWQDFMFACSSYPTYPELLESIGQEARCNVRRLRHHPSIVLYAGNNEDYQVAEFHKLEYDIEDKDPESWLRLDSERSTFPARYIYEYLLPRILAEETSKDMPYWPSSPFSPGGRLSSDPRTGDVHEWDVWHGRQKPYQLYATLGGRFVSEFGMQALPNLDTIKYFAHNASDRHSQSAIMDFHNKAEGHERRIAGYLAENLRDAPNFESYIHCTQLLQAEAISHAYRGWRRQWGQGRKCGGALVWQMNDCWPCTSWALVDYFLRKKPAYYEVARALKAVTVNVRRAYCQSSDFSASRREAMAHPNVPYEVWICSSHVNEAMALAEVELQFVSISSGHDVRDRIVKKRIRVEQNGTTEVMQGEIDVINNEAQVLVARLWIDGECISRDVDWPQPLRHISFAGDRGVNVKAYLKGEAGVLVVSAKKPVKGLVFEERDGLTISDSALSVIPGDEQIIKVTGICAEDRPLGWWFLGLDEVSQL